MTMPAKPMSALDQLRREIGERMSLYDPAGLKPQDMSAGQLLVAYHNEAETSIAAIRAEAAAAERERLLAELEAKLQEARSKVGAVDGYDYRSGEEYGLRRAERIVTAFTRASAPKGE